MSRPMKFALLLLAMGMAAVALVWALNVRDESPMTALADRPAAAPNAEQIRRGEYLARAGNCAACHTARGGTPYAGGRGIDTPFGTLFAGNLTPDPTTGLGDWSADEFWRALHNGRSKSGRLLYPAFPYASYTKISRGDADAIHAYLQSLPPVQQATPAHELRFPYNTQAALAVWRALYFSPGVYRNEPAQTVAWNRGAYLVQGLGHCNACHAARNSWGASESGLGGGLIPMQGWYAPSLADPAQAGVAHWELGEIVALFKTGMARGASVSGPMSEVVRGSTQYLSDADLRAMAGYLKALPQRPLAYAKAAAAPPAERLGTEVYEQHCASCHGKQGQGEPGIYPALAGNRAVTMEPGVNVLRAILQGGFAPATAAHPRPFGMPPFAVALSDAEIAAVASHVRQQWGNTASPLTAFEVSRARGKRAD
ncbi:c-type cytochrome [Roseateles toxinivorans]|uniref:Mono/diheme cytochrome c family protein n=1 Tax=Roseateles toxinivorans TaxID=270368 RepID=A0A4R6QH21_9BURK|nr:cytochrome c [Roseateles toxinivorans]TDP61881.1 mono/diheme cytochrome c family protein [Roseateles toxinivorans]